MAMEFQYIDFPSSVSEFFTPEEYAKMTDYERKHLSNLRQNFEALRSAGVSVDPPEFMHKKVQVKMRQKCNKRSLSKLYDRECVPPVKNNKIPRDVKERPSENQHNLRPRHNKKEMTQLKPAHKKKTHCEDTVSAGVITQVQNVDISNTSETGNAQQDHVTRGKDRAYCCTQCHLSFSHQKYLLQHVRYKHFGQSYGEYKYQGESSDVPQKHEGSTEIRTLHKEGDICETSTALDNTDSRLTGHQVLLNISGSQKRTENVSQVRVSKKQSQSLHDNHDLKKEHFITERGTLLSGSKGSYQECNNKQPSKVIFLQDFSKSNVSFTLNGNLKRHSRKHTGERPYKCDVCGVSFTLNCSLKEHIRKHTGERPYKCDVCGVSFTQSGNLKVHIRKHTGERPYKCDVCGVSFTLNGNLKAHIRKHTGERPYKCDVCGEQFARCEELRVHIIKHTGKRERKSD